MEEVVGTKLIYGTLAQKNFNIIPKNIDDIPVTQFKTFGKAPYSEVSFGVENILKIFRVDFVWRLTYRNDPKVRNFGVKMSAALTF